MKLTTVTNTLTTSSSGTEPGSNTFLVCSTCSLTSLSSSDSPATRLIRRTKLASSSIAKPLAIFLTSVVRHGYLPQCLSDCVLIPIPKGSKDPSCSLKYRAFALASTVSKVLEHLISRSIHLLFVPALCSLVSNQATLQLYVYTC